MYDLLLAAGGLPIRIVNVMLSRGLGGIQGAFVNYAAMLEHLGHEVTNCSAPGAECARFLPSGAGRAELANKFALDPLAVWRAARLLDRLKPEAVIVHGSRALTLFAWARRLTGSRARLIAVLHRHRFKRAARADAVVCVTQRMCDEARAAGIDPARIVHMPNFIKLPERLPALAARAPRAAIGFLGRMVPEKGLDILLEAAAILRQRGQAFRLLIGGDGAERADLEARCARLNLNTLTTWLGWVDDPDLFYDAIDVFCVPSRHESFGLVILQAHAAGKPLVATRTVGAGELIRDGVNGLLCEATPADLADHLARLLGDEVLAMRLARQGQRDVADYDLPALAPRLQAILERVVDASSDRARLPSRAASAAANRPVPDVASGRWSWRRSA
ncbi:MAG: glycosyltransferase family 4 protein [Rhodospirillaceae bacterium]|nr:glycosyltransferase family 4 protein [Rhodospirillaceae bacterium]